MPGSLTGVSGAKVVKLWVVKDRKGRQALEEKKARCAQLVVRTGLPPSALAASVLHALRELNPNQPAAEFRPVRAIVDRAVSPRRFFMFLVTAFAGLGLLLATLGIYGVVSYSVTRQTPEIGIRMALGASTGMVQRQVLARTLRLACAGMVLGNIGRTRSGQSNNFTVVRHLPLGSADVSRNGPDALTGCGCLRLHSRPAGFLHQPMEALRSN